MKYKFSIYALVLVLLSANLSFAAQDQQIQQKLATLQKIGPKFSFIVIGDNRSGDEVYRQIVTMAVHRKPDLIVNTGDMIRTPGSGNQWDSFWEMSKPIAVPYLLTVGNHDAHPKVPGSESTYREQVDLPGNELYYSFVAGNALFVVLDSYMDDQEKKVTGKQKAWLEGVLATSKQKHRFVFIHHPLYTDKHKGKHHGNSLDRYPAHRDALQSLFVKYKVTAVFAGHEHMYLREVVDGIQHVVTGGGGAPLYTGEGNGGFHHLVHVSVDGDNVSAEVVDVNGKIRDKF